MRLAVMKIGANITFSPNNASAANADILYFLRQLEIDDHDITIVTHRTRNTKIPKRLKFLEIAVAEVDDFKDTDAILLFNGSINFFGGACDPNLLAMYRLLNKLNKPIIFVQTDGQLYFKQLWPSIHKREWAQGLHASEFWVDTQKVVYLTQGRDHTKLDRLLTTKPDAIIPEEYVHYPIAQTILAKHDKFIPKNETPFGLKHYDLGFGGATRNTYKRKRIEHYYNRDNTLLFGNLRGVKAPKAKMQAKCSYQHFIRMMMMCKATVIVGDEFYENNYFTLRMYESLLADCITFIDHRMDSEHRFYGLSDEWLYVTKPADLHIDAGHYILFKEVKDRVLRSYNEELERQRLVARIERCIDRV